MFRNVCMRARVQEREGDSERLYFLTHTHVTTASQDRQDSIFDTQTNRDSTPTRADRKFVLK